MQLNAIIVNLIKFNYYNILPSISKYKFLVRFLIRQ